jgi:hypothetical protein
MNTLRHTKSEENLAAEGTAQAESASLCAFSVYGNPDEETGDCWSQEDDEISQQVHVGYLDLIIHFMSTLFIAYKNCILLCITHYYKCIA